MTARRKPDGTFAGGASESRQFGLTASRALARDRLGLVSSAAEDLLAWLAPGLLGARTACGQSLSRRLEADGVLRALIALAARGCAATPENAPAPADPTAAESARILGRAVGIAARRAAAPRTDCAAPAEPLRRLPWDAVHDGHLAPRRAAWALGLVRWARAQSPEAADRITVALAESGAAMGLSGADLAGASRLWRERRPIVVIDAVNVLTMKLVHDLWLADRSIAVVLAGSPAANRAATPFRTLGIPWVVDGRGLLTALLGLDLLPALVEPRLGGFTTTAATGLAHPRGLPKRTASGRLPGIPVWLRTLAEIGVVRRCERLLAEPRKSEAPLGADATLPAEDGEPGEGAFGLCAELELLAHYRLLLTTPVDSGPAVPGPEGEEIRAARAAYLAARERLALLLAREETAATRRLERAIDAARSSELFEPPEVPGLRGLTLRRARLPQERRGDRLVHRLENRLENRASPRGTPQREAAGLAGPTESSEPSEPSESSESSQRAAPPQSSAASCESDPVRPPSRRERKRLREEAAKAIEDRRTRTMKETQQRPSSSGKAGKNGPDGRTPS